MIHSKITKKYYNYNLCYQQMLNNQSLDLSITKYHHRELLCDWNDSSFTDSNDHILFWFVMPYKSLTNSHSKICMSYFVFLWFLKKKKSYIKVLGEIFVEKIWRQKSFVIKHNLSTLIEIQIIKFSCFAQ